MANTFDSIFLAGRSLRPAPFVSTSYEYARAGDNIVGGFLIVTLTGTLVDENIQAKITEISELQSSQDCVNLTIGCPSGGTDFLDGAGRIRSIDVNQEDQPYVANYTIVIAIETIGGKVAVEPSQDFANAICVPKNKIPKFLRSYSESVGINGTADIISSNDSGMLTSKSYIKASGNITFSAYINSVCGLPGYDPKAVIDAFLKERCKSLLDGCGDNNILKDFNNWEKWLDSKSLDIDTEGDITWVFDIYLLDKAGHTPKALIDITAIDRYDEKTQVRARTINGNVKGLSLTDTTDHLSHKADSNERMVNAQEAFDTLENQYLLRGTWPGTYIDLNDTEEGDECEPPDCPKTIAPVCFQRISHNITKSVVNGEISFDMQFEDINSCRPRAYDLDITIDENIPTNVHQEIFIPNRQIKPGQILPRSIIQITSPSSLWSTTITVRGVLKGCDVEKMPLLQNCVNAEVLRLINTFYPVSTGWRYKRESKSIGKYSYSITHERFFCNIFSN